METCIFIFYCLIPRNQAETAIRRGHLEVVGGGAEDAVEPVRVSGRDLTRDLVAPAVAGDARLRFPGAVGRRRRPLGRLLDDDRRRPGADFTNQSFGRSFGA
jgi:hypothetical protein